MISLRKDAYAQQSTCFHTWGSESCILLLDLFACFTGRSTLSKTVRFTGKSTLSKTAGLNGLTASESSPPLMDDAVKLDSVWTPTYHSAGLR